MLPTWFVGVVGVCLSASPNMSGVPVDQILRDPIAAAIRWQAYWEGVEALGGNYQPRAQIEVRVLRTVAHLYAFLARIRLGVNVTASPPNFEVQAVGIMGLAAPTNAEAVTSFLQMRTQAVSGCSGEIQQAPRSPAKNDTGKVLPLGRPCPDQDAIVGDETFAFVLPELTPPDSIQRKSVPADKDALATQVQRYLKSRSKRCGATTARIPFFSDIDPRVYVFIQSAGECPSGVATYSRAGDGRWEFGKFFADLPEEELSGIIAKIKANTSITVTP